MKLVVPPAAAGGRLDRGQGTGGRVGARGAARRRVGHGPGSGGGGRRAKSHPVRDFFRSLRLRRLGETDWAVGWLGGDGVSTALA